MKALASGTITIADVVHEPDCRRPRGGPCTCLPDVVLKPWPDPERN